MKTKLMISLLLAVVAVLLLVMTFFTPWYSANMKSEYSYESYYEGYYETESSEEYSSEGDTKLYFGRSESTMKTVSGTYKDTSKDSSSHDSEYAITPVMRNTRLFVVIAIVATVIGIAGIMFVEMNKLDPKIGAIIIAIGFIFALVAPLYMMTSLPGAIKDDSNVGGNTVYFGSVIEKMGEQFFGKDDSDIEGIKTEALWGGSTAWYLALIAAVINLVAVFPLLLYKVVKEEETGYEETDKREEFRTNDGELEDEIWE